MYVMFLCIFSSQSCVEACLHAGVPPNTDHRESHPGCPQSCFLGKFLVSVIFHPNLKLLNLTSPFINHKYMCEERFVGSGRKGRMRVRDGGVENEGEGWGVENESEGWGSGE